MHYQNLPQTDLELSGLCLGTGDFGSKIGKEEAYRLMDAYLDYGGNFIDTAKIYCDWVPGEKSRSEKIIAAWIKERKNRHKVIVATKGGHYHLDDEEKKTRLKRAELLSDLEASLNHLETDCIDLYWLHRDDPSIPVEEILDFLHEQSQAGKIRYYGCSNWKLERIREAADSANRLGFHGFVASQSLWNLAAYHLNSMGDPTIAVMNRETLIYHKETGFPQIPYSSQANGFFAKLADEKPLRDIPRIMYDNPQNRSVLGVVKKISHTLETTVNRIVLSYLTSQPFTVLPIVGCQSIEQLTDSFAALEIKLTPEELTELEQTVWK